MDSSRQAAELQQIAEDAIRGRVDEPQESPMTVAPEDMMRMLHELQVHQIELEMQNEELQRSRLALEDSRSRYFELYNLAPVAYVTLNEQGLILELNRAAERLLGAAPNSLIKSPLSSFVAPGSQDTLDLHRNSLRTDGEPQSCELQIVRNDGSKLWVSLECSAGADVDGSPVCRAVLRDISERKRYQDELEESKDFATSLIRSMPDGFSVLNPDGTTIDVNPALCEMTGFSTEELLGCGPPHPYWPPEEISTIQAALAETLSENGGEFELLFMRKNGERFPVIVKAFAVKNRNGETVHFAATVEDITLRRESEEKLRDFNDLLALFMRHSPIYSFIKTVTPNESRVLMASENFREMIGIPGSLMVGKTMEELFPAELAARISSDDWQVVSKGEIKEVREEMNGRMYFSIKFPICQRNQTLLAGYTIDITEQVVAEQTLKDWNESLERRVGVRTMELQQSESRFRLLAEATFEGIAIVENGVFIDVNSQFAAIYGLDRSEVIGCQVMDFIAPESRSLVSERIQNGMVGAYEFTGLLKCGTRLPMEANARMIDWQGKKTGVTAVRDLTAQKQAADRLLAQQSALDQSMRLAMVSEISAGIIHQIGQPLTAIMLNLVNARSKLCACDSKTCEYPKFLSEVQSDVTRMMDITTHLRALGDPEKPQRLPFDLNKMISEQILLIRPLALGQGINLMIDLDDSIPEVSGDAVQVAQVVNNLIRNALDACKNVPEARRFIEITTRSIPDGNVELGVSDRGEGFAPGVMELLFTPFFTTKQDGVGIGLRLSKTIVEAHGGSIKALRNPNETGAMFRVVLPVNPTHDYAKV